MTLHLIFIIMPSPSLLPHLGSASATVQCSHMRLRWSRASRLSGEHAPAQFPLIIPHLSLHTGKTLLQLVFNLVTSLSMMQSLEFPCLNFPATLVQCILLSFRQMEHFLHLEVETRLPFSGISKLVGLSGPSMAILSWFVLFPSHQTAQ